MLDKDVVDSLHVFAEFNPTYNLMLVSCLLDQKKIFLRCTKYTLVGRDLLRGTESNRCFNIEKKNEGVKTQKPLFVLC